MPSAERRQAHNSHERRLNELQARIEALEVEVRRPLVDRLLELGIEPKPAIAAEHRRRKADDAARREQAEQWRQRAAKACADAEERNRKAFAKADQHAASVNGNMLNATEACRRETARMHAEGIAELERQNRLSDPRGEYSDGGKLGR